MADNRDFEAQKLFDLYLHDYLVKKKMYKTAEIFRNEAHVSTHRVVVNDPPEGFLRDWFNIFYDVFSSRQQNYQNDKGKAPVMNEDPMAVDVMQSAHATGQQMLATNDKLMIPDLNTVPGIMPPTGFDQFDGKLEQQAAFLPAAAQNQQEQQQFVDPAVPFNAVPSYMNPYLFSAGSSFMQDEIYRQPLIIDGFNVASRRHRDAKLNEVQQRILSKIPIYNAGVNRQPEPHPLYRIHLDRQRQLPPSLSASSTHYSHSDEQSSNSNQIDSELMKNKMKQPQPSQPFYQLLQKTGGNRNRISSHPQAGVKIMDNPIAEINKSTDESAQSFSSADDDTAHYKGATSRRTSQSFSEFSERKDDKAGLTLEEVRCLGTSSDRLLCCHFSSDGNLLAVGGNEKKLMVWNLETNGFCASSEGYSHITTDIRFRPSSTIFASSSFDKTVRVWDAAKPNKPQFKLIGHADRVTSLDFHPELDILCSCDNKDEIRCWNIDKFACVYVSKEATKHVRFQPPSGKLLAAATSQIIKVIDTENGNILFTLKGHSEVLSICWDPSGKYLASVNEESARLWSLASGGYCVKELVSKGHKFQSCIFHPGYSQVLIIGGTGSLELWNPSDGNGTVSIAAHHGLISALSGSLETRFVASVSHDHAIKLWK